jgi:XTP/dITP diphosphohydrolase
VLVRWPDGRELSVDGACAGTISATERGERGFGYDAVFVPDEGDGRSFAEMSDVEKHAISHRGRAFRNLLAALSSPS